MKDSGISSLQVQLVDSGRNANDESNYPRKDWRWDAKAWVSKRIRNPSSPGPKLYPLKATFFLEKARF